MVILSFELLSLWSVLVQGHGGNAGSLLWLVLVGVGPHSLGSPQTGLKSSLGWHIPNPCGPNLGTLSTGGSWDPSYLECIPGYLWTLGHSVPGLDLWSLYHHLQIQCRLRWSIPGQLDHFGSWGNREFSCPSILSHSLSVWGYMGHWQGCCPVVLWSGQPSTWLFDSPTL